MYNSLGVKLKTPLRFQFSHLNSDKFKHSFDDEINPVCACGAEVETTEFFLLWCHFYSTQKSKLFDQLEKVAINFLQKSGCFARLIISFSQFCICPCVIFKKTLLSLICIYSSL